jgi:hypothetical protein
MWLSKPLEQHDITDCARCPGRPAPSLWRFGHPSLSRRAVSCSDSISHNEAESTAPDECAAGAQVLLNAVLECDRRLG